VKTLRDATERFAASDRDPDLNSRRLFARVFTRRLKPTIERGKKKKIPTIENANEAGTSQTIARIAENVRAPRIR